MGITKATEYALRAIARLAGDPDRVQSAPSLARDTGIPARFLAKICSCLVAAGLLESLTGARGGFRLARPAGRISVWDVVAAVEEETGLVQCLRAEGECEGEDTCGLKSVWERAQSAMQRELERTTLDEVVRLTAALRTWPSEEEAACAPRSRPGADPAPSAPAPEATAR